MKFVKPTHLRDIVSIVGINQHINVSKGTIEQEGSQLLTI